MKRKFVKENKAVLREFVGSIISAIVTGKLASDVSKRLNADPVFKNKSFTLYNQQIRKLWQRQNSIKELILKSITLKD